MNIPGFIRIGLEIVIISGVYHETGPWTAGFAFLMLIHTEITGIILRRGRLTRHI